MSKLEQIIPTSLQKLYKLSPISLLWSDMACCFGCASLETGCKITAIINLMVWTNNLVLTGARYLNVFTAPNVVVSTADALLLIMGIIWVESSIVLLFATMYVYQNNIHDRFSKYSILFAMPPERRNQLLCLSAWSQRCLP